MKREQMLAHIHSRQEPWDVIIIGGGATGLGAAVDAASRGYRTLLVEQADFAKGTSSRSTKLIHGGLRYLQQGNITLVTEALKERGRLCHNAPHLIHHLPFLVPNYHWWEGPFYGIGLKIYDLLAGKLGIEKSRHLSREETLQAIPTLEQHDLRGGMIYYDGQFDDARLAICLARTAVDLGAVVINYMKVTSLIKKKGLCVGVEVQDQETQEHFSLYAHVIINATGVFADTVLEMDDPKAPPIIAPSQGIHLVLDRSFLPSESAIMIPHTSDGRVLFMVPWHNRILLGTTDTPIQTITLEPRPLQQEIDFLLLQAAQYLSKDPSPDDILSMFAGVRPLIKSDQRHHTSSLSRDHSVFIAPSGLVTIAGGKWTTYRKMAEDVINKAAVVGGLPEKECTTQSLHLHGYDPSLDPLDHFSTYGTDIDHIRSLEKEDNQLSALLHPNLPYRTSEIIYAIRHEMARTLEDLLSRRTRSLLLDAKASIEIAPKVAGLLARELKKNESFAIQECAVFTQLANTYLP